MSTTSTLTLGNFSQAPADALSYATGKGYTAVHIEQGVPVLDRDLNLLGDLIAAQMKLVLQTYFGDGIPGQNDFAVTATANAAVNDFTVAPGTCLIGGIVVSLAASMNYTSQAQTTAGVPIPTTFPRTDTVYLSVAQIEIDDSTDPSLGNSSDVAMRTSTRIQNQWQIGVAIGPGAAPAGTYLLASLVWSGATARAINDLRQPGVSVWALLARVATLETLIQPVIDAISPALASAIQVSSNGVLPVPAGTIAAPWPQSFTITGSNLNYGPSVAFVSTDGSVVIAATFVPSTNTRTSMTVQTPAAGLPPGNYQIWLTPAFAYSHAVTKSTQVLTAMQAPAFSATPLSLEQISAGTTLVIFVSGVFTYFTANASAIGVSFTVLGSSGGSVTPGTGVSVTQGAQGQPDQINVSVPTTLKGDTVEVGVTVYDLPMPPPSNAASLKLSVM